MFFIKNAEYEKSSIKSDQNFIKTEIDTWKTFPYDSIT